VFPRIDRLSFFRTVTRTRRLDSAGTGHLSREIQVAKRTAFVTIGQAPRSDVTPDILAEVRTPLAVDEFGALDGMDADQVRAMAPDTGEERLVTRLKDGTEVIIGKKKTQKRLQELFTRLDGEGYDLIVLLCTGHFEPFRVKTPFLEPQLVVDNFVKGLSYGAKTLGVLVPNEKQTEEVHGIDGLEAKMSAATPYGAPRFAEAGRELADTDVIVMHCMGYSEAMRREVAEGARRPVLLSRRMVAQAIDLIIT
jgi:protein AroM